MENATRLVSSASRAVRRHRAVHPGVVDNDGARWGLCWPPVGTFNGPERGLSYGHGRPPGLTLRERLAPVGSDPIRPLDMGCGRADTGEVTMSSSGSATHPNPAARGAGTAEHRQARHGEGDMAATPAPPSRSRPAAQRGPPGRRCSRRPDSASAHLPGGRPHRRAAASARASPTFAGASRSHPVHAPHANPRSRAAAADRPLLPQQGDASS